MVQVIALGVESYNYESISEQYLVAATDLSFYSYLSASFRAVFF